MQVGGDDVTRELAVCDDNDVVVRAVHLAQHEQHAVGTSKYSLVCLSVVCGEFPVSPFLVFARRLMDCHSCVSAPVPLSQLSHGHNGHLQPCGDNLCRVKGTAQIARDDGLIGYAFRREPVCRECHLLPAQCCQSAWHMAL